MQPSEDSNLLKFLRTSRQRKNRIEKKCMPEQTYGVSSEAPAEFHQQHTLVGKLGYKYEHDEELVNGSKQSVPFSQKVFFTIDNSQPSRKLRIEMTKALEANALVFHRKKGLLSEYMDKNGWMSKVHKLMGDQRTETARGLSNRDREERIRNLRKPPNSVEFQQTAVLQKPVDRTYFDTIPVLMGEKMRIRRSRNRFASDVQNRRHNAELTQAQAFKINNFEKRELSYELTQRAQSSRTNYDRLSARTANSPDFKKTNGFRSTRAQSFKAGITGGLDFNEQDREDTELSDFQISRLNRTERVIRANK